MPERKAILANLGLFVEAPTIINWAVVLVVCSESLRPRARPHLVLGKPRSCLHSWERDINCRPRPHYGERVFESPSGRVFETRSFIRFATGSTRFTRSRSRTARANV